MAIVSPVVRLLPRRDKPKLTHPKQVWPGKPSKPRLGLRQVRGQLGHYAIAPLRKGYLLTDGLANLPIQINQSGIYRRYSACPRYSNQIANFNKICLQR